MGQTGHCTILITGVSGFVGRRLAADLLAKGHKVAGTYHSRRPADKHKNFKLYRLDLGKQKAWDRLLAAARPRYIYHLAAMSVPRESWHDPQKTIRINAGGTVRLLESLARTKSKARLLFISTNLVYGRRLRTERSIKESALPWPEDPYSMSKALAELACLHYCRTQKIDVVMARPFNHIGGGQSAKLVFSDWCRQIAAAEQGKGDGFLRVGNLDAFRDILHVEDVVRAYVILAGKGKPGEVYNVCTRGAVKLERYALYLVKKAKISMKIKIEADRARKSDPHYIGGDSSKLRKLGWKPEKNAFDALDELLAYWRENL